MKSAIIATIIGSTAAFAPAQHASCSSPTTMNAFTSADLPGALPPMGFWDPLGFAENADENTLKVREKHRDMIHILCT